MSGHGKITGNCWIWKIISVPLILILFWFCLIPGIKCPVCSKFVLPDDIECHLVMCLTKPRLIYNGELGRQNTKINYASNRFANFENNFQIFPEDVLSEDKGECVICLEELTQGDTIARLPCLCIYHKTYAIWNSTIYFTLYDKIILKKLNNKSLWL